MTILRVLTSLLFTASMFTSSSLAASSAGFRGQDEEMGALSGVDDLVTGVLEWNGNYSPAGSVVDGVFLGTVADEATRQAALGLAGTMDFIAIGDYENPASVEVIQLSTDPRVDPEDYQNWLAALDNAVAVGNECYLLTWQTADLGEIQTLAFVDDETVVWDGILQSVVYEEVAPGALCVTNGGGIELTCLWFITIGEINWSVTAHCCPDCGELSSCDYECNAWMSPGTALIQCEVTEEDNCCVLSYAYGFASPGASVRAAPGGIGFEVSGLAFKGNGSGTVRACCVGKEEIRPFEF